MTIEVTLQNKLATKEEIVHLILSNVSAIPLIAEQIHVNEDIVTSLIGELVEEGILKGTFSPDGLRFYRSDIKMPTKSEEVIEAPEENNTKLMIPKAIIATGISLFIAGQIFIRVFVEGSALRETAAGMVLMGMITIFGGLFSLTKVE